MDPRILNFLYLNGLVVLALVAYLFWRPKRSPSRLKLRQSSPRNKLEENPHSKSAGARSASEAGARPRSAPPKPEEAPRVRVLTVIFQFNGHEFEAYEVLGLAAGSSLETVEKCYEALMSNEHSDTHEFFRMAYNAIKSNVC